MTREMLPNRLPIDKGLGRDALRRLLLSLIISEQKRLAKKALIRENQQLSGMIIGQPASMIDEIKVTEAVLGFDSLGTLDLILSVNQFFQLSTTGIEDYLLVQRRIGDWIDLLSEHQRLVGEAWQFGFETSGSVGPPKLVVHNAAALWEEMRAQQRSPFNQIGSPGRVLSMVPPHHIYGFLFSCVFPELVGMDVIDLHQTAPTAVFRHAQAGDLILGTPFTWELVRRSKQVFVPGVSGVTSAGPSSSDTWAVRQVNKLEQMTEVFGSTETGGIGSRIDESSPFELLLHLGHDHNNIIRKINAEVLPMQDALEWEADRKFHVQGRLDHVVQIAGVNVSPALVSHHIQEIPGVVDVAVRPGEDRLRAFVVPSSDADIETLEARIRQHLSATLEPVARPGELHFGAALPRNEMGKPIDWNTATGS